jgi:Tol biopolymer transport system component
MAHQLPWNLSDLQGFFWPSFSPDGKALVGSVISKGSYMLQYQPIGGSPTHLMTDPSHDSQTAFAWSPSGSKLGVLRLRRSSDVVLITDLGGKQAR